MQNSFRLPQPYSIWINPVVVVWHGSIADGKNCVVKIDKSQRTSFNRVVKRENILIIAQNAPSVDRNVEGWCYFLCE